MPPQRLPLEQTGNNYALAVTNVAQALLSNITINAMTQSWILCNPSTNTSSIFWGYGSLVTIATGIEVTPGSTPQITIEQIRQLYELQDPDRITASAMSCQQAVDMKIPVLCFNFQNIYFITNVPGPVNCSALIFNNVYV